MKKKRRIESRSGGRLRGAPHPDFTMIELLVVISILVILAGLLLPAVSRAREKAQLIACQSKCKQWGMALLMYGSDFKWMPHYMLKIDSDGINTRWYEILRDNSYVKTAQPYDRMASKTSRSSLYLCPAAETVTVNGKEGYLTGKLSWEPNHFGSKNEMNIRVFPYHNNTLAYPGSPVSRWKNPSKLLVMIENKSESGITSWTQTRGEIFGGYVPYRRHSNSAVVVLGDFHSLLVGNPNIRTLKDQYQFCEYAY